MIMFLLKVLLTLSCGFAVGGTSAYLLSFFFRSSVLYLSIGIVLGIVASVVYGWVFKDA